MAHQVSEEAIRTLEGMGFLRDDVLEALRVSIFYLSLSISLQSSTLFPVNTSLPYLII